MISIVQEYRVSWPTEGPIQVHAPPIEGQVQISPDSARRRANSYLSLEVAMEFQPGEPVLVWSERPVWRMPINLYLHDFGELAAVGVIEVDAMTRALLPLSENQIQQMRVRAHELVSHLTSTTAPTE